MRVQQSTLVFSFPVPHQRLDVLNLNTNYVGECMALGAACVCINSNEHIAHCNHSRDYSTGTAEAGEIRCNCTEHGTIVFAQNTSVAKLCVLSLCHSSVWTLPAERGWEFHCQRIQPCFFWSMTRPWLSFRHQ